MGRKNRPSEEDIVTFEKSNNQLAKTFIYSEFNVSIKEGCGLTASHLALITGNETMALFLLERNAKYDEPLFSAVCLLQKPLPRG